MPLGLLLVILAILLAIPVLLWGMRLIFKSQRFRFSLRTLMALVLLLGSCLAFWANYDPWVVVKAIIQCQEFDRIRDYGIDIEKNTATAIVDEGEVRQWEITTGKLIHSLKLPEAPASPHLVRLSPDGSVAVSLEDANVQGTNWYSRARIWNVADAGKSIVLEDPVESLHFSSEESVSVSIQTKRIAFLHDEQTGTDQAIDVWSYVDGKHLSHVPQGKWNRVALSPDGEWLAFASYAPPGVFVQNLNTGKPYVKLDVPIHDEADVHALKFSPAGDVLYVSSCGQGLLVRVEDFQVLALAGDCFWNPVYFSPNGRYLSVYPKSSNNPWACDYWTAAVLDTTDGSLVQRVSMDGNSNFVIPFDDPEVCLRGAAGNYGCLAFVRRNRPDNHLLWPEVWLMLAFGAASLVFLVLDIRTLSARDRPAKPEGPGAQ